MTFSIQSRLSRKFTRQLVRAYIENITRTYKASGPTALSDFNTFAGWFTMFNIPIKYSESKQIFQIIDPEIKARFISDEDEGLFDLLNSMQEDLLNKFVVNVENLADTDPRKIKMYKIITYLEYQGYTVELMKHRYELKGISDS